MKRFLFFLAALLLSGLAHSDDLQFQQGGTIIRLTQGPCAVPAAIATLWSVAEKEAKAAEVSEGRRKTAACWVIDSDNDVAILTEDGRGGFIPASVFKRIPSI